VVETLIRGLPQGFETHFLKGNHEAILLDFLDEADSVFALVVLDVRIELGNSLASRSIFCIASKRALGASPCKS
jgi:hypothetical protein